MWCGSRISDDFSQLKQSFRVDFPTSSQLTETGPEKPANLRWLISNSSIYIINLVRSQLLGGGGVHIKMNGFPSYRKISTLTVYQLPHLVIHSILKTINFFSK